MDNLYLAGKPLLLVGDMLVNFEDSMPKTSKNSVKKVLWVGIST